MPGFCILLGKDITPNRRRLVKKSCPQYLFSTTFDTHLRMECKKNMLELCCAVRDDPLSASMT